MANSNLSARIKRLERAARGLGIGNGIETLVVRIRRLAATGSVLAGVSANGEFFPCTPGEPIAETEQRAVESINGRSVSVQPRRQIVRLRMTPVEELPE